ncbi:MAG: hypothetical protein M9887_00960 [Chitinophagales bacterium]|nr:hypothetical protein [Chitinophagales bacterium]
MRAFCILMSIYLLALSCMPCNDVDVLYTDAQVCLTDQANHDHHEHTDACSPFCACACCHVNSIEPPHTDFVVQIPEITDKNVHTYYQFFIQDYDLNIWQPPKI